MAKQVDRVRLENGTLIRHKTIGYTGRIDGTTEIRECFTAAGKSLVGSSAKQTFQYRVVVAGDAMRRIAPEEDLEILEAVATVACSNCKVSFRTKPGLVGKVTGLCECGNWICPVCLACQPAASAGKESTESTCASQRKRLVRKIALEKKRARH